MTIGEILQNEINSSFVHLNNHNNDNGFLYCDILSFENGLLTRGYEPIGICKHIPFEPPYAKHSIAFCYKIDGESGFFVISRRFYRI